MHINNACQQYISTIFINYAHQPCISFKAYQEDVLTIHLKILFYKKDYLKLKLIDNLKSKLFDYII